MEEERRNAAKLFNDRCNSLEVSLSEYEKQIIKVCTVQFSLPETALTKSFTSFKVCKAPLPRDVESLQQLIVAHKDFEGQVQGHEPEIDQVKNLFNAIPQKTPKEQAKLDKVSLLLLFSLHSPLSSRPPPRN